MSILDNLPHTCQVRRRIRIKDSLGGSRDSFELTQAGTPCWQQLATDREITEFMKRGISVTNKIYFTTDVQLDERDVLEIQNPTTQEWDTYEVRSRAKPDASAGKSVVWRVMVEYTTTGSTEGLT